MHATTLRRALGLVAAVALTLGAATARGEGADLEVKSAARKLGNEAQKLFDAGDYEAALEKFNLADSLVSAPTLGLRAARCLVKLGRLVEASERYLEVTRMHLDRSAPMVMRKAQVEAHINQGTVHGNRYAAQARTEVDTEEFAGA